MGTINAPVKLQLTPRDGGQALGTKFAAQEFVNGFPNPQEYGVDCMQTLGGTFLAEPARNGHNPEEFIKTIGEHFEGVHQTALYRDQFGLSTKIQSLDYHRYTLELLAKSVVETLQNYHGMNDPEMTAFLPPLAKEYGISCLGTICIQVNPGTMDNMDAIIEEHLEFAEELLKQGHEGIYLKSANGVLDPKFMGALVSRLREKFGEDLYIGVHCHDTYGLAVSNYLAAIKAGASSVDVLPDAYAGGTAQPGISLLMHAIEHSDDPEIKARMPIDVNLDAIKQDEHATYAFRGTYYRNELEYNENALQKALDAGSAGGAIGVLKGMGLRQLLEQVLETKDWPTIRDKIYDMKAKIVRPALGYPTNVTPYELMMDLQAAQCVLNMKGKDPVAGEKLIDGKDPMAFIHPMAVEYLIGKWGKVSKTVDQDVQKRALDSVGLTEPVKPVPIEDVPSTLDAAGQLLAEKGIQSPELVEKYVYATIGTGNWNEDDPGKKWIENHRKGILQPIPTPEWPVALQEKKAVHGKPQQDNILHEAAPEIFAVAYKTLEAQKLRDGFYKDVNKPEIMAERLEQENMTFMQSLVQNMVVRGKSNNFIARALMGANDAIKQVACGLGVKADIIPQFAVNAQQGLNNIMQDVSKIRAGLGGSAQEGGVRGQFGRAHEDGVSAGSVIAVNTDGNNPQNDDKSLSF